MASGYGIAMISVDSGITWAMTSLGGDVGALACSADGTRLLAGGYGGLYTSRDSGATWSSNSAPATSRSFVASSADGEKLVAVFYDSGIWISQSTPAPLLTLRTSAGVGVLAWTLPSLNFILEQNADLSMPNWIDATNTASLNLTNLQYEVSVSPLESSPIFFRLRH